jgi:hypothetical protein
MWITWYSTRTAATVGKKSFLTFNVALNLRGWVRVEYDFKTIDFCEHEFAIVYPNHVLNTE